MTTLTLEEDSVDTDSSAISEKYVKTCLQIIGLNDYSASTGILLIDDSEFIIGQQIKHILVERKAKKDFTDFPSVLTGLRARSGLTWNELSSALGVSRRALHHWTKGQRISGFHIQRLEELVRLINKTACGDRDQTRAKLLIPRDDGQSLLSQFAQASKLPRSVPISHLTLGDFFDAEPLAEVAVVATPKRRSTIPPKHIPPRDKS